MPYFSIITCTYNSEAYLADSIASVEGQFCDDFEHIFIDAFSIDGTIKMIEDYGRRHPNKVHLIRRLPRGISDAMNFGVEKASGEVIIHLHGDDAMANDALNLVKEHFIKTKCSVLVGNCRFIGSTGNQYTWPKSKLKRQLFKCLFMPLMFFTNLVPHPATYLKKSVFERHGYFDSRYKTVMDYDFWFRILRHESLVLVDDVLAIYRFHSETVSAKQHQLSLKEIDEIREKYKYSYPLSYIIFSCFLNPLLILKRIFKAQ